MFVKGTNLEFGGRAARREGGSLEVDDHSTMLDSLAVLRLCDSLKRCLAAMLGYRNAQIGSLVCKSRHGKDLCSGLACCEKVIISQHQNLENCFAMLVVTTEEHNPMMM